MAFFKPKPNLPDAEKAKVEFHLQQIAECIGFERFQLPVLRMNSLLGQSLSGISESNQTPDQMIGFIGKHLSHDVSGIRLSVIPQPPEKCGGGG